METACWSRSFAQRIARVLGYRLANEETGDGTIEWDAQAQSLVEEITQGFRYLPLEKVRLVLDYADFLRSDKIQASYRRTPTACWVGEKLREIRDLVYFLKGRYGHDQPVDESDFWTDEDRRDFTLQSLARMENDQEPAVLPEGAPECSKQAM
jgi:hypothetical protein